MTTEHTELIALADAYAKAHTAVYKDEPRKEGEGIASTRQKLLDALEARDRRIAELEADAMEDVVIDPVSYKSAVKKFTAALAAGRAALAQPQREDCRIELVTAIHMLASDFENRLGRLDPDDRKIAEGDIAHAMAIAAKWNWNGSAHPQASEPAQAAFDRLPTCGVKADGTCDQCAGSCMWFGKASEPAPSSQQLEEAKRIAADYTKADSDIDSGNLYWALMVALANIGEPAPSAANAMVAEMDMNDRVLAGIDAESTEPAPSTAGERAKMIADALEHADSLRVAMQDQSAETIESLCALLQSTALPDSDPNAPWLTKAHMLCTDHGVPQGGIEWRLEVLRELFSAPVALPVGELTDEQIDTIAGGKIDYFDRRVFARAILEAARKIGGQG